MNSDSYLKNKSNLTTIFPTIDREWMSHTRDKLRGSKGGHMRHKMGSQKIKIKKNLKNKSNLTTIFPTIDREWMSYTRDKLRGSKGGHIRRKMGSQKMKIFKKLNWKVVQRTKDVLSSYILEDPPRQEFEDKNTKGPASLHTYSVLSICLLWS